MSSTIPLQSHSCSISPLTRQVLQPQGFHRKVPTLLPFSRARRRNAAILAKYTRWDSNAEERGARPSERFDSDARDEGGERKKRQWWSEDPGEEPEEEEVGIVEEVIDSIWMLKVLRSYGWTLPAILISLLLATGPKAFLSAMAFPVGQSAVTLAYNRLSGKKRTRPRVQTERRRRRRRKGPSDAASSFRSDKVGGRGRTRNSRNGNLGAQSWVDDGDFPTESGNGASSFGGWEELDGAGLGERKSSRASGRSSANTEMGRKRPSSQSPLLLRLLVSMFPFLGLWTKMFW